jgi:hypothetical protein
MHSYLMYQTLNIITSVLKAGSYYSSISSNSAQWSAVRRKSMFVHPWQTKTSVHGEQDERSYPSMADRKKRPIVSSPLSPFVPRNLLPIAILCRSPTHSYSLTCSQNSSQHVSSLPSPDSQASHHGTFPTLFTHHDACMSLSTVKVCSPC